MFIKLSSPFFAEQLDDSVTIWKGSLHHSFPIREWLGGKTAVICLIAPQLSRSSANFYWVLLEKQLYMSMGIHRFIFYSAKAFNPVPSSVSSLTVANRILRGVGTTLKNEKTTKGCTSQGSVKLIQHR